MKNKPYRIKILGCPVDNLSMKETILLVEKLITSKTLHQHVVVNVDKLLKCRKDPSFREIISRCDIINADGMPIVWASKLLGNPIKERVAGIDLMNKLVELAVSRRYKVFFLGANESVVKEVVNIYKEEYPTLLIAGFRNGYWSAEEEKMVVNTVRASKPDILFVGISSPKKERFIGKYRDMLKVPFIMGVGGSFDVIAGKRKRAPIWMQRLGLEWLFRLIQEPKRLWKRYFIGNTIFIWLVLKEFVRTRTQRIRNY